MQKTPDEIKKGLECCGAGNHCKGYCPYDGRSASIEGCTSRLSRDALSLIQQLQAENAQLNRCIDNMTDKLNAMNDEAAKLQAKLEMIRQAFCNYVPSEYRCDCCKHSYLNNPGTDCCPYVGQCDGCSKWEYYGIQKEESDA